MVSLITPSTVYKRFKIQLLALSLVVSVHHTLLLFLNLCIGYLLITVLISRFIALLIMCCLYMNLIMLVFCSAFDRILIFFVLPLLAHYIYYTSIKKSYGFRSFSNAATYLWNHLPNNIRTAPTYISFRKNQKTYLFNQAFPT